MRSHEWHEYYKHFSGYFSAEKIREHCYPRIIEHDAHVDKAIVLVHGLTDSPYYMSAIGDCFFRLGYNVYLPLLHFHGLRDPQGIEDIELEEWKKNVGFAIDTAAAKATCISIGGLSTGAALAFYHAERDRRINDGLYLFSAAIGLHGGPYRLWGKLKETIVHSRMLSSFLNGNSSLVGAPRYRYARMDLNGARQLILLIRENQESIKKYTKEHNFPIKIFAAHSQADTVASSRSVLALEKMCALGNYTFFNIPRHCGVSHSGLVLDGEVDGMIGSNVMFEEMTRRISLFVDDQHLAG